ncbi:MAG: hypothetical protein LXA50_14770 [Betaproteobacteria bacterium]|nr:hypothetical protein [Betaproteobacteria bacterium]
MPRCLDLDRYRSTGGVAWSLSSNLLEALDRALSDAGWPAVPGSIAQRPAFRTQALREAVVAVLAAGGLQVLVEDVGAAPFLVTVALPCSVDGAAVGAAMQREGFTLAWESAYLRTRNWIQLAWMGRRPDEEVLAAARALVRCCRRGGRGTGRGQSCGVKWAMRPRRATARAAARWWT